LDLRRRTSRVVGLRRARCHLGTDSGLGSEPVGRSSHSAGNGGWGFPDWLSIGIHRTGLLQMRALAILVLFASAWLRAQPAKDTCVECHAVMEGSIQRPALLIKDDIHTANGLSCADCHGGDRTSEDPSIAMNKAKGFIGKPKRT